MTPRFGIDTSILVRLLTGKPEQLHARCVSALRDLIEGQGAQILVANIVIGEAYIAVQHHYGVSKADVRTGMLTMLRSGLVSPLNGQSALTAIESRFGAGLIDRLIADDYRHARMVTLTLDRKMSALPAARLLVTTSAAAAP